MYRQKVAELRLLGILPRERGRPTVYGHEEALETKRDRTRDRGIIICSDGISDQISVAEMAETVEFFYKR